MTTQAVSNPDPDFISPKIQFKETLTKASIGRFRVEENFDLAIELKPNERGAGVVFVGDFDHSVKIIEFFSALKQGVEKALSTGILGYPMTDIEVRVLEGIFLPKEFNHKAIEEAALKATIEAIRNGKPVLLEPIMNCQITSPEELAEVIVRDLNMRRSKIISLNKSAKDQRIIECHVPLMELFQYAHALRALSQGKASFSIGPDHYSVVPLEIANKIIKDGHSKDGID